MTQALAVASLASHTASDQLGERDFAYIATIIGKNVGIRLTAPKRLMVEGRLRKRVRALQLDSLAHYCELLHMQDFIAEELPHLVDVVTTNKTDFFRESEHFELLRRRLVPSLLADRRPGAAFIKVWSAASSVGAEAFTAAMVLAEMVRLGGRFRFALLGTDICNEVLEQAQRAVYSTEMVATVPPEMRQRYLMQGRAQSGRGVMRIVPELRRVCHFARLNLMDATYPVDRDVDVIFLRNVLIYFDRATQRDVIVKISSHLRPGGYLLLGHSESMIGTNLPLRQVAPATLQRAK